ncbi:PH domain-containing protein [Spirosoma fluminis]
MKSYKSKIGLELAIPLSVLLIGLGSFMLYKGIWPGVGIIGFITFFIIHLFVTTHYTIDSHLLRIKSGFFFNKSVEIASIRKIIETRNPISSPALSLDRIEVIYNRFDSVLLSPQDKIGFIDELKKANPDIEVQLKDQ